MENSIKNDKHLESLTQKLTAAFKFLVRNNSGRISIEDIEEMMGFLGYKDHIEDIARLFSQQGLIEKAQTLTCEEFVSALHSLHLKEVEAKEAQFYRNLHVTIDKIASVDVEYLRLLRQNSFFSKNALANPELGDKLRKPQTPIFLLIGCSDSRVPPDQLTGTKPGEIFIHRNIANLVHLSDINCLSCIQYSICYLNIKHIIILGHTHCGGVKAAMKTDYMGIIDQWISPIRNVAEANEALIAQCKTFEEQWELLVKLNVEYQVKQVCKISFVQDAWKKGINVSIHGCYVDLNTGKMHQVNNVDKDNYKDILSKYHRFSS